MESFTHFCEVLRTYFNEVQFIHGCELCSFLVIHYPLGFEVVFVAHEQNLHVLVAVDLDLFEPVLNVREGLSFSDVVYKEGPNCASVVGSGDGSEILLSCSVPYLEFDVLILDFDGFRPELNSDGNVMGEPGLVLYELEDDARFSDS